MWEEIDYSEYLELIIDCSPWHVRGACMWYRRVDGVSVTVARCFGNSYYKRIHKQKEAE